MFFFFGAAFSATTTVQNGVVTLPRATFTAAINVVTASGAAGFNILGGSFGAPAITPSSGSNPITFTLSGVTIPIGVTTTFGAAATSSTLTLSNVVMVGATITLNSGYGVTSGSSCMGGTIAFQAGTRIQAPISQLNATLSTKIAPLIHSPLLACGLCQSCAGPDLFY